MCLQCTTDAIFYGDVVPGFGLYKAVKPHPDFPNWGLIEGNDPTFVWDVTPEVDPEYGWTDEQVNARTDDAWDVWFDKATEFEKSIMNCGPRSGYDLWKAALEEGYDPEKDGYRISLWLFHKMGEMIRDYEPVHHGSEEAPRRIMIELDEIHSFLLQTARVRQAILDGKPEIVNAEMLTSEKSLQSLAKKFNVAMPPLEAVQQRCFIRVPADGTVRPSEG